MHPQKKQLQSKSNKYKSTKIDIDFRYPYKKMSFKNIDMQTRNLKRTLSLVYN